jgi:tripeptidyl-peptidase-1
MNFVFLKVEFTQKPSSRIREKYYSLIGPSDATVSHSLTFAINLRNIPVLEALIANVSNPFHEQYGKYLSLNQMGNIITNHQALQAIEEFFAEEGVTVKSKTLHGELIRAQAPIQSWEKIFSTKFFQYHHKTKLSKKVHRVHEYTIPMELQPHLMAIFHLADFPPVHRGGPIITNNTENDSQISSRRGHESSSFSIQSNGGVVTPSFLNSHYSITNNTGNNLTSQSCMECIGDYLSSNDLTQFQTNNGLPIQGIVDSTSPEHIEPNACANHGSGNCAESNLDFQYMMAIAQRIPTYHLYDEDCDWNYLFFNLLNGGFSPDVISISYGDSESNVGLSYSNFFNVVAMKLGLFGVTIVIASGDDGVAGYDVRGKSNLCGYHPDFPSVSPYVLAVGGTKVINPLFKIIVLMVFIFF